MLQVWIKYTMMFAVAVLFQVLVLNQVQFSGYLNPYFYLLFVFLLPVSTPGYAVLLLSFFLGLSVDVFSDTGGLHAASTVLAGFLRTPVIRVLSSSDPEQSDYPGLKQNGMRWFLLYTAILVFSHHFMLYYLEVFSFTGFFRTLLRVVFSTLFTVFVIVLSQFLVFRK